MCRFIPQIVTRALLLAGSFHFLVGEAFASGANMPWETPLENIMNSASGPVARAIGVIAIIATGLTLSFGEGGGGMRKMLWVVFGLSIAFAATSFFLSFFGFAAGAVL